MPRSCVSCGGEVSADGRFCHSCGAALLDHVSRVHGLGRHYDAACAALEVAAAAEASGKVEIASAAHSRAAALLDPLGCVNPF